MLEEEPPAGEEHATSACFNVQLQLNETVLDHGASRHVDYVGLAVWIHLLVFPFPFKYIHLRCFGCVGCEPPQMLCGQKKNPPLTFYRRGGSR